MASTIDHWIAGIRVDLADTSGFDEDGNKRRMVECDEGRLWKLLATLLQERQSERAGRIAAEERAAKAEGRLTQATAFDLGGGINLRAASLFDREWFNLDEPASVEGWIILDDNLGAALGPDGNWHGLPSIDDDDPWEGLTFPDLDAAFAALAAARKATP